MPRHLIQPTIYNAEYGITGESDSTYFKISFNVETNSFGCGTYENKAADRYIQYIEKI
jgi:hypothetical protein